MTDFETIGIPLDLERFCDILNGTDTFSARKIGTLAKFVAAVSTPQGIEGSFLCFAITPKIMLLTAFRKM